MKVGRKYKLERVFLVLLIFFGISLFLNIVNAEECPACSNRTLAPTLHSTSSAPASTSSAPDYCVSSGGSHAYEYIQDVKYSQKPGGTLAITADINIANPTGCTYGQPCPAYDSSPEYVNAWIDWNGDKVFEPEEKVMDVALTGYTNINYHGTMTASNIVTIPANAVNSTWMRVNLGWGHDPNDPCEYSWTWGDIIDKDVKITPLELKVVRLDAFDNFDIKDISNPIWTETNPSQYNPIADGMKNGFLFWTYPGSFKIKATLDASPQKPSWEPKVMYTWSISGTDQSGSGEFTGWVGEFNIKMPQKVGKYTLSLVYSFYDDKGNKLNSQSMSHTLYATYENSQLPDPKEIWLEKATDWASGATTEDETASKINIGIHDKSMWNYRDKMYSDIWKNLIEGTESEGNCWAFAETWVNLNNILGIDGGLAEPNTGIRGDYGYGFVTKNNSIALKPESLGGNAHLQGQSVDRWRFSMHQIGKRGIWIWSNFYDPTFGKEYNAENEFIEWHQKGDFYIDNSKEVADLTEGHKVYLINSFGNNGWGDFEYHSPFNLLNPNVINGAVFTKNYSIYGIKSDGDEIYNSLVVDTEVNATKAGNYSVLGVLKSNNTPIASRSDRYSTNPSGYALLVSKPEVRHVILNFSGEDIYNSGIDGNYTADLAILDENGFVIDNKSFETPQYNHKEFGEVPARVESLTDYGKDVDNNGLFDYLVLEANINASKAMNYSITGILNSGEGDYLIRQTNLSYLANSGKIELYFDGAKIHKSQKNGPYILSVTLTDKDNNQIGYAEYNTSAYNYTDFQGSEQKFTGTYSDHGIDTDSDGLYNYLATEVGVKVLNPGNYTVEGWLYDSSGKAIEIATNYTHLDSGTQPVTLNFNGFSIYQNQINGPYYLKHLSLRSSDYLDFIEDAYTTSVYKFTDFQKPPIPLIALTGKYQDYGTDANGDGIFENLTVDVEVNLTNPGNAVIKARLLDANENEIIWASNTSYIPAGKQILKLNFDGKAIYKHGVDGPYYLRDVYVYHTGDPTQSDYAYKAYTTSAYKYAQFGKDSTPPTTNLTLSAPFGNNSWYTSDVQVNLTATDNEGGSGVNNTQYSFDNATWNTYTVLFNITNEGTTTLYYYSTDNAGNVEPTKNQTIKIDKTPPQITITTPANGSSYILNQTVLANWSANDSISGIASVTATTSNGKAIDTAMVGAKTFSVNTTDNAGNQANQTLTYSVVYNYSGLLPPFKAAGSNDFNLGRTIPVKFQLWDANGNYISTATARIYLAKVTNGVAGNEIEGVSSGNANTGNLFRNADNQYIFNLATKSLSTGTWQIRIELDDSTSKYATIGLK